MDQTYDTVGRLASVVSGDGLTTYAGPFAYDPAGHVTGMKYGNSKITAVFGFNPQNLQLANVAYSNQSQTLFATSYGYAQNGGNNGQITRIADSIQPGRSLTYAYDALSRLKTAVTDGSSSFSKLGLSWTYDRYGNRTAQTVTAGSAPSNSLGIDPATNRILGETYDANGNLLHEAGRQLLLRVRRREPPRQLQLRQRRVRRTTASASASPARTPAPPPPTFTRATKFWPNTSATPRRNIREANFYAGNNSSVPSPTTSSTTTTRTTNPSASRPTRTVR